MQKYEIVKTYYDNHGELPLHSDKDSEGDWLSHQKRTYQKKSYPSYRLTKLRLIPAWVEWQTKNESAK